MITDIRLLMAIDPGALTGWAIFEFGWLAACGLVEPLEGERPPVFERPYDLLVAEMPRVYPKTSIGGANDLVTLAYRLGRLVESVPATAVETPHPSDWKGSVRKDIHQPRILARLTPPETTLLPALPPTKLNNVVDAVGIGLWRLRRL